MEGGTHALVELLYVCLFPQIVVEDEVEGEGVWVESEGVWVEGEGVWVWVRVVGVRVEGGTHALVELLYVCLFSQVVVEGEGVWVWVRVVGVRVEVVLTRWLNCSMCVCSLG